MPIDSYFGKATPTDGASLFSTMQFILRQYLSGVRTAMLVQVKAVSNDGGVSPVGTVDVQPLVHSVDGAGNITVHGTVYGMPYFRLQGGANAIILDPQVGDLGLAIVADRDTSSVKASKAAAAPASSRTFSFSDGLYIGGFLNGTPQQYVQFNSDGITVVSPTAIDIKAPTVTIDGKLHVTGAQTNDSTITASGDVKGSGTSLHTHVHAGVQSGGSDSGPPA